MFTSARVLQKASAPSPALTPSRLLNEENIRLSIQRFAQMQPIKPPPVLPTRNAAVLIPVCVVNERVALLYTLRAASLKSHRGQVSFPGGVEDSGDGGPEGTAIREAQEELGLNPEKVFIWGKGNVIVSRQMNVVPVVGFVDVHDVEKELRVNPHEVREAFTVPVETLCDPRHVGHTQFRPNYSLPVFTGGRRKIWGLTAAITHFFLKAFLPKEHFRHSIRYIPPLRGAIPHRFI